MIKTSTCLANMFSKLGEKAAAAAASAKQAVVEAKASATEDLDEISGVLRILSEATGQLGLSTIPFHDLTLGMKYHKQDIVAAFSSTGWDHGGGSKSSSRPQLLHLLGMAHLASAAYEDGPDGINKYLQGSDPAPLKKASDKNLLFTVACEDMQLAGVKVSTVIGSLEPYSAKRAFLPAWYVASFAHCINVTPCPGMSSKTTRRKLCIWWFAAPLLPKMR
jgi:hypothetical protein